MCIRDRTLLILGGTRFLGRHLAEQALARGHRVTLLHRGRSGPGLFPQAEPRIADRDGDLSALDAGTWDAAIDTSAYVPRQVRKMAERMAGRLAGRGRHPGCQPGHDRCAAKQHTDRRDR